MKNIFYGIGVTAFCYSLPLLIEENTHWFNSLILAVIGFGVYCILDKLDKK